MSKKIMLMAGGTGGHVFPALSIAKGLRAQGHTAVWLGTKQGLEARVVPEANIPLFFLTISGVRGAGIKRWLMAPFILLIAIYQALVILHREKPDAVLGFGGFVSGPGGIAAFLLRIPLVVHEQNAIPGSTNRYLAKVAKRVLQGFPHSFAPRYKAVTTGNPVRETIEQIEEPDQRLAFRHGALRVLILGGSQGASKLNQVVPEALAALPLAGRPEVCHQTGPLNYETTQEIYTKLNVTANVEAFIEDMASAYAWADIIVCRSGALTVAEIMATGVASILIPFPYAVDDHQRANAEILSKAGAAVLLLQENFSSEVLKDILLDFQINKEKLLQMAQTARQLGAKAATQNVINQCLAVSL